MGQYLDPNRRIAVPVSWRPCAHEKAKDRAREAKTTEQNNEEKKEKQRKKQEKEKVERKKSKVSRPLLPPKERFAAKRRKVSPVPHTAPPPKSNTRNRILAPRTHTTKSTEIRREKSDFPPHDFSRTNAREQKQKKINETSLRQKQLLVQRVVPVLRRSAARGPGTAIPHVSTGAARRIVPDIA
eukprot:430860-Rhodomonas_salina.1